ncbi:hypothetical protein RCOM_0850600 [Ricinus communis]|uniref:Uncharacterized protein n=1 Tax=Ricinus communis TaxID=3988 RepID=B9RUT3_RICCO|nr:hypothetical protein RCOM_0850600 [Ricinus communis]
MLKDTETPLPARNLYAVSVALKECSPMSLSLIISIGDSRIVTTVAGYDVAGLVMKVGNQMKEEMKYMKILMRMLWNQSKNSSLAEYIAAEEKELLALKPKNLNFDEAEVLVESAAFFYDGIIVQHLKGPIQVQKFKTGEYERAVKDGGSTVAITGAIIPTAFIFGVTSDGSVLQKLNP